MTIKIIGLGWVGKAVQKLFPDALIHSPSQGHVSEESVDVCFVCVPTPLNDNGSLDCSIVEEVVSQSGEDLIIIRSTVNPGFCDYLEKKYNKNVVFQPEYIGETVAHPLFNETERSFLILGGRPENRRKAIELYQTVYNANVTIRQVTNLEAEVIKLSENRSIAFKVMEIQELFDVCEAAGVDFYTIREGVYFDDPRMNLWWTWVFKDKRGFNNSKCLQKDVPAFAAWAESLGYDAKLTKALIEKSNEYSLSNNP